MKIFKNTKIVITVATLICSFVAFSSAAVSAQSFQRELCGGADLSLNGANCGSEAGNARKIDSLVVNVINILTIVVGIVAVIMIIVGGFKLITSGGDSGRVASGRQTIIYALVGLIVVALAQFIARFLVSRI